MAVRQLHGADGDRWRAGNGNVPHDVDDPRGDVAQRPAVDPLSRLPGRRDGRQAVACPAHVAMRDVLRLNEELGSLRDAVARLHVRGQVEDVIQLPVEALRAEVEVHVAVAFVEPPVDLDVEAVRLSVLGNEIELIVRAGVFGPSDVRGARLVYVALVTDDVPLASRRVLDAEGIAAPVAGGE